MSDKDILEVAAATVLHHHPDMLYAHELTTMLWNDMSGASHARSWHRDSFHDTYTAHNRTLQLLIPAGAFLDTAWCLWHQRRGAPGSAYDG